MSAERDELVRQVAIPRTTSVRLRKDAAQLLLRQFDEMLAAAHRALAEHEDAGCSCRGCSMLRAAITRAEGKS